MKDPVCDICGNPTDGYVCPRCTDETAHYLRHVVDLAAEVETNVARLARYATHDGRRAPQPDEDEQVTAEVNRSQPVTVFGFQASKERQLKNALRAEPLPVDLNASARAAYAFNDVMTWARAVEADRGHPIPDVHVGEHPAAVAAAYLLGELDWMRHQPFAAEAFDQLKAAGAVIRRIVDRPPDQEFVGVCDCGGYLYARRGASVVVCRCSLRWKVQESRASLLDVLRDRLVTASEAATFGVLAFPDLQRERIRKLVQSWTRENLPNPLIGQETPDGPVYSFGEILDRLSRSVVRLSSVIMLMSPLDGY
jgi:hypothetical protein